MLRRSLAMLPTISPHPPSAGELVGAQGPQHRRRVRHGGLRRPPHQGQGVLSLNHLVPCCSPQRLQGILPTDGAVVSIASWDFGVDPNGHPPLRHAAAFVLTNSTSIQVWVPQHLCGSCFVRRIFVQRQASARGCPWISLPLRAG
jgi:hypothetical protein